ncbi:uncharacterized protein B0H18DRAFT_1071766 [Fomitopsis serialis]|uniref:uncharacterized protein n=1 Tax=Fomitopsis serialis TaxID=139415 RepID=UPI002008417A|nr:uncharacterized protein B0H18DRAFT_1071766 [Neoantrodia serialis]KAH9910199.1 hypothetical protein B0H18DRAFT_1071766 [Neoantrodia serialis]
MGQGRGCDEDVHDRLPRVPGASPRCRERGGRKVAGGAETSLCGRGRGPATRGAEGGSDTASDACLAVVGSRQTSSFGEVLASIRGDRGGPDVPHGVDQVRTYEYSSASVIERGKNGRTEIPGYGTGEASNERDELRTQAQESWRAGQACKDRAATRTAQGRGLNSKLGGEVKRITGGEAPSAASRTCDREQTEVGESWAAAGRVLRFGNNRPPLHQRAVGVSRVSRRVATAIEDRYTGRTPTTSRPLPSQIEGIKSIPRGASCMQTEAGHASDVLDVTLGWDGAMAREL